MLALEEFCVTGRSDAPCPPTLADARRLETFCEADAAFFVYSECGDYVTFEYAVGYEDDYALVFSAKTGELVYGSARLEDTGCTSRRYVAGEHPGMNECRSCSYCGPYEEGGAGSAGEILARCALDADGRVQPLATDCRCIDEGPCTEDLQAFCLADSPFDCPLTLEDVRLSAASLCENGRATSVQYAECDEANLALLSFGQDEAYTALQFSEESGALSGARVETPAVASCSDVVAVVQAGNFVEPLACRFCGVCEGNAMLPLCERDEAGRLGVPGGAGSPAQ